ncbi:leucyl aminopeptidase [Brevibacillus humidisoli]|uniref:leucyl aminopeptidase n=1 Tax=Brevibacillus humidisoli TaxID=2895522 RepID=UPI001E52E954|nr:leucyl aminopeptidase [Brevibacillus humidisoli]UFJ39646.1 leucyl aminopeptidase [Brevibacillus humidisoli]
MIKVEEKREQITTIPCDDLVVGLFKDEEWSEELALLNEKLDGALHQLVMEKELSADYKSITVVHTLGKTAARRILFVGLGDRKQLDYVRVRNAFARGVKRIAPKAESRQVVCVLPDHGSLSAERCTQAVTEAFCLASYTYEGYRQKPRQKMPFASVTLLAATDSLVAAEQGKSRGEALSKGTNLARDLVNMPGNYLTPEELKNQAVAVAERYGMEYEVLDRETLKALKMGGVLSVAQGSAEPPYVVVLKYQGRKTWDRVIGLIGKGVTFDTGGISIKPVAGMQEMKSDMGGSAAVIGAMEAIGRLKPKVNVMAVIGCVENMPSSTAYKPGDVITTMSGKTVEIITTDAEGRLVLADCITYAKEQGVDCLIDCATLTGGIVVALGNVCSGAMTNNQPMADELLSSAEHAGERLWQLPTFEEYHELNKSSVADIKNSGGRNGHGIIGGVFLQVFAEDTPWVHLDIAGTAYVSSATDINPAGATGVMTRTLAQFVLGRSE